MAAKLSTAPQRVLFVCTGNTCRSVLAEYIARHVFHGTLMFESAGLKPQCAADAENAIYTLKKNFDIDAGGHVPRDVRSLDLQAYSLIIALDKDVAKRLVKDLGVPESKVKLWDIDDPYGDNENQYETCSIEIKKKIVQLRNRGR